MNPDLLYLFRKHFLREDSFDFDIHSQFWSVAFFDGDKGNQAQVKIVREGQLIPIEGFQVLLIPPFSNLKWQLKKGLITWEAFILRGPFPFEFREPYLFDVKALPPCPRNQVQLLDLIRTLDSGRAVGFKNKNSILAERTKAALDQAFPETPSMKSLAEHLRIQLPSLDREFHNTFDLSPREYNVRQRTLATYITRLFERERSMKSLAAEMGFFHMGNFNKQCRRYLNAKPSELKLQLFISESEK